MPGRTLMVVAGILLSILSFAAIGAAIASSRAEHRWAMSARPGTPPSSSSRPVMWGLAGGVGLAAGMALIGVGMGRWTRPRPPRSEADYTGPGDADDPGPRRVV